MILLEVKVEARGRTTLCRIASLKGIFGDWSQIFYVSPKRRILERGVLMVQMVHMKTEEVRGKSQTMP